MNRSNFELPAKLVRSALASLERGEEISLRAVARDASVSAMAPYRHFKDKTALLEAVAAHGFEELRTRLIEADDQADSQNALVAQGQAYLAFARTHPQLFRLMFSCHSGGPPAPDDNAYGVMVRRVRELAPANVEAATLACWSAVHGMATLALDGGLPDNGSPNERQALTLIVRGIASQPTPRPRR